MPAHKSAEKAVRKILRRTRINRSRVSRIRTFVRKVEETVLAFGKDPALTAEKVQETFVSAERELMRGAQRGVLHRNAASRKVSRLAVKVKKVLGEVRPA